MTELLQLFLGLPLFLLPWGFHSTAAFDISPSSFLNVWPIHLNFLFLFICKQDIYYIVQLYQLLSLRKVFLTLWSTVLLDVWTSRACQQLYVPPGLTFKNSTWWLRSVYVFSEQTATFALCIINSLFFITEVESVYSAVRTEYLYKTISFFFNP